MNDETLSPNAHIAILGLGEAGALFAADLIRAGVPVRGWDPNPERNVPGMTRTSSDAEAVTGARAIISVNWSSVSLQVAQALEPVLRPGQLFADFNTSSPKRKLEVAEVVGLTGASFADVALMSPVPGKGIRTPALVSGPGASEFANLFSSLGMPVTNLGFEVGMAASRKLARSVFFKGMAAAVGEALEAARRLGCEDTLYTDIAQTFQNADASLVKHLLEGSRLHAKRRTAEMHAASEMLRDLGIEPHMAAATATWLRSLTQAQTNETQDSQSNPHF